MAKRHKVKKFSFQGFEVAHYKSTEAYARAIEALMSKATEDIAHRVYGVDVDLNKEFSFEDYPRLKAEIQKIIQGLAANMRAVISSGARKEWLFACKKNDAFLDSILNTSKINKDWLQKMQVTNLEALKTFQERKVEGMNLSERVWKYSKQFKDQIEVGLDVGLGEGRSAQQLSRDLRQNLKDPNRLFRRVRDKRGNLVLSKAAKVFHPGQGVYRSSYKNAMRLARSEVNMAYRESDHLRWQSLDFVIGFEVHRSNREPKCKCSLCERLKGRYPKTFKYKGWHSQCLCYATPILRGREEINEDRSQELRSILRGDKYDKYSSKAGVIDFPDNFKDWVSENAPKQAGWASTPYFIKDNFKDGKLSEGLIYAPSNNTAKRIKSPEQVADIQKRWDERKKRNGLGERARTETQRVNESEVADLLRIAQGEDMSFDDANGLRGNPNYQDRYIIDPNGVYKDKKGNRYSKNPKFKKRYSINCQSCVVANELRRRGMDVEAYGNTGKSGSIPLMLSRHTELAWVDDNGKAPASQWARAIGVEATLASLNKLTGEVGRYHIKWVWNSGRGGHIITCERLSDGTMRYYDPQNGEVITDFPTYASKFNLDKGIGVLRVDNLQINKALISGVVFTPSKKKKM